MAEPVAVNVSRFFSSLLPFVSAALLVVLVNLPISVTGGLFPSPMLALAAIYFWSLVRPDLISPFPVLILGLLEDLLSGGPPGLWAAGFMAAYAVVDRQRENLAGLAGPAAMAGFAAIMALAAAATYALTLVVYQRLPPLAPVLLAGLITVVLYPLVAVPMGWMHRRLVGALRGVP